MNKSFSLINEVLLIVDKLVVAMELILLNEIKKKNFVLPRLLIS